MSIQSTGIKYRKENFKALRDEMINMKFNLNKGGRGAYVLNDKHEYIYRVQKSHSQKRSEEKKYILNQIMKHYELSRDQSIQGFNNKYFIKLSELMSKNDIKANDYSKQRIELYNSRINKHYKSYINYLKKKGYNTLLISSINKKINPKKLTYNWKFQFINNKFHIRNRNALNKLKDNFTSLRNTKYQTNRFFQNISFSKFNKSVNLINENILSSEKEDIFVSNQNIFNDNLMLKSASDFNVLKFKENKYINLIKESSFPINEEKKVNEQNNDNDDILIENKSKEEFLKNYNKTKYIKFLKSKYNFINEDKNEFNEIKAKTEDSKIKKMFKYKPKNKFLQKSKKDGDKLMFFNKIKKEFNKNIVPKTTLKRIINFSEKSLSSKNFKNRVKSDESFKIFSYIKK